MPSRSASPVTKGRRERKERKCHICSQVFFKAEHLSRHVRSHTKEKPFECDVCHKIYARHDTLLRHSRSHTESRKGSTSSPTRNGDVGQDDTTEGARHGSNRLESDLNRINGQSTTYSDFQSFSSPQSIGQENAVSTFPNHFDANLLGADAILQASTMAVQGDSQPPNTSPQHYLQSQMAAQSNSLTSTLSDAQSSPHGGHMNAMQTSPSIDLWDFGFDSQWPSWLAGDDFDLKAVNSSIAASMYPYMLSPFPQPVNEIYNTSINNQEAPVVADQVNVSGAMHGMRKRWFTHMDEEKGAHDVSGTVTPRHASDQANVDENYRVSLSKKLRQRVHDDSLPSTEFLNLCIRMYFSRFNPIFPIIHGPSFRPSTENSLLLLSICSVGSLFIGSAGATAHGIKIFETLNKSILASWESVLARSPAEGLNMVSAAVIGQTFAMLSGHSRHLVLVESFHGTVIAWARQSQIFKERHKVKHVEGMLGSADKIEKAWKSWVQSEHMIRITLGLHIQDAELARIFHHEPLLRHGATRLPVAASNKKFNATSASQWASVMIEEGQMDAMTPPSPIFGLGQTDPIPSRFYAYTILEGIGAAICESREESPLNQNAIAKFKDELVSWYDKFQRAHGPHENDPLCLMILWHSVFLTLFVDFDMLERAIGKEGPEKAQEDLSAVVTWASSTAAKRCIVHASLIQKQLEMMRVGTEPAIHVPLALFHAALAWYCYTTFALDDSQTSSKETLDFPEIKHLGINPTQHLFEANGFKFGRPTTAESSTLCLLTDLLQRIGHWEIARKYASILGSLLHGGTGMGMDIE